VEILQKGENDSFRKFDDITLVKNSRVQLNSLTGEAALLFECLIIVE
jgi:hypothetical protein